MKRIPTPLGTAMIVALLTALSSHAHCQSPLGALIREPVTENNDSESPAPRPYTVPIDPQADRADDSQGPNQSGGPQPVQVSQGGLRAQAATYLEPVNIEPLDTHPDSVQPVVVQPMDVKPPGLQPAAAETGLETIGLDPLVAQPLGVDRLGSEPLGGEPLESWEVETVGTLPDDSLGVETVSAESAIGCECFCSSSYRSQCGRCCNRACLLRSQGGQSFIGGWLQQGFTGNFSSPSDRSNGPVLFNDRSNDYRLNQLYFFAERDVYPNPRDFDVGGRVDFLFGSDARFLTVPGLEQHKDRTPKWNSETADYGIALPQAYLEFATPWFNGVSIKVGHFYANTGYEAIAAPDNFFYSHSYVFLYGQPFTFTGVLSETRASDHLTLRAGYTNGWDVWDSSSREFGVLAGFTLNSTDKRSSLTTTLNAGSDVTTSRVGGVLFDADRYLFSLVLQHQIGECWRYVFQHDFGYQEDGEVIVNRATTTISNEPAKWYGINQYLIHDINQQLSSALRVEWFRDQDQSRLGIPVSFNPGGPTFRGGNYVALTGGLNWRPHANVAIRPELRWDYADLKGNSNAPAGDPGFRAFDDNTRSSQVTAAMDMILLF